MAARRGPTNADLLAVAWGLGWRIAAGLLIGGYLDAKLSTAPFLTLALAIGALVSGVLNILKLLERSRDDREDEEAR